MLSLAVRRLCDILNSELDAQLTEDGITLSFTNRIYRHVLVLAEGIGGAKEIDLPAIVIVGGTSFQGKETIGGPDTVVYRIFITVLLGKKGTPENLELAEKVCWSIRKILSRHYAEADADATYWQSSECEAINIDERILFADAALLVWNAWNRL